MALTVDELDLGQLRPLASGGMAEVFDLPDFRIGEHPDWPLVYKRYKAKARPVAIYGLLDLVKLRDGFHPDQQKALDQQVNWMVRVVKDDKAGASGIVLPRLDGSYFVQKFNSYGEAKVDTAEAQLLVGSDADFQRWRIPNPSMEERLQICRSLALGLGKLHRADVIYGDLSLRNFLYRLEPSIRVMFVDTDAVRKKSGNSPAGKQPHTGDWEPPEALAAQRKGDSVRFAIQNLESDRYKLGLAILRILARVHRAGETRDPHHLQGIVPRSTFSMMQQALHGKPHDRPTAKDWYQEFR